VTAHFEGNQLVAVGDGSGNTIRVDVVGSGEFALQRISYLDRGSWVEVGRYGGFSSFLIDSGTGNDTVTIDGVLYPGSAITVNGNDVVNLNSLPRHAPVNIQNTVGYTDLNVTDPVGDFDSATLTVGPSSLTLAHPPSTTPTW
jgi:hypothetical protein